MRRPIVRVVVASISLSALANAAQAVDHANLDSGRPLRLDDAYAISAGELALEFGVGFNDRRGADNQVFAPFEILWGALPNLQLSIGSAIVSSPHDVDDESKSGDLHLSALYNFNQETSLPAFAIKADLNLPTGVDSAGVDGAITGILTKSFGSSGGVSVHLNAGYEFLSGTDADEKDGLYQFAFGISMPIGAPMHTRTTLIADIFLEEAIGVGTDDIFGMEVGVRHQLTERIVLDAGIGTELDGPADRSRVFAVLGASITF